VLESTFLDEHRREALAKIFGFLGVDTSFWCSAYERKVYVGSRRPIVSPLGAWVRDSAGLQLLRKRLPPSIFYHIENLVLSPFRMQEPSLCLLPSQASKIVTTLQAEMALLRHLTGLNLPTLTVTMEQALSSSAGNTG
jgi:hypothetical protein